MHYICLKCTKFLKINADNSLSDSLHLFFWQYPMLLGVGVSAPSLSLKRHPVITFLTAEKVESCEVCYRLLDDVYGDKTLIK